MAAVATHSDRYGLPLSTTSAEAAAHYRDGQERTLAFGVDPAGAFERAITADPEFALAYAALANARLREGQPFEARDLAVVANELASRTSPREQGHVAVVVDATHGRGLPALQRIREQLALWPRDALLLNSGVSSMLFAGMQQQMVQLTSAVEHAYPEGDPFFLGLHAFALQETRQFDLAHAVAERALALYPLAAFAAHALAHVFYERGAFAEGIDFAPVWLARYDPAAGLHLHMSWHFALFLLARGEYSRLFDLYETHIRPPATIPGSYHLYDPVALLWRTDACGVGDSAAAWLTLANEAERRSQQPGILFADLHNGMALAAAGRWDGVDGIIAAFKQRADRGNEAAGVALALMLGMAAFARGDYEQTIAQVEPVEERIFLVGGSKAQRDLFHDTLLEALLRAGRYAEAETRLRAKLDCRPAARDFFRLAQSRTARGDVAGSAASAASGRSLWTHADADAPVSRAT
jgi:tetratricopeptide (TPR) repeat protein